MLLTIEQIVEQLYCHFIDRDEELHDLILRRRRAPLPRAGIDTLEKALSVILPDDFVQFVSDHDLDDFSLGPIHFGTGPSYLETLRSLNGVSEFGHWWLGPERPRGMIAIACSDPYTILLNTRDGHVHAITGDSFDSDRMPVALDFDRFVQGVGSLFLRHLRATEVEVAVGSGHPDFWKVFQPA